MTWQALRLGFAVVVTTSSAASQCELNLMASDAAPSDEFGASVALAGDVALVGAPGVDDLGQDSGAAYVFRRQAGVWTEEAKLLPLNGAAGDAFGTSVAILGDIAVVGAPDADKNGAGSGTVYVFTAQAGVWTLQQEFAGDDTVGGDRFGLSVTVGPDVLVVGAAEHTSSAGAAYVFRSVAGTWPQEQKLTAAGTVHDDHFGSSVALDGTRLAIGAPFHDSGFGQAGSAYVFEDVGGAWVERQELTAMDGAFDDFFGMSLSLEGDTLLVGAEGADGLHDASGAAYVFELSVGAWNETAKLTAEGADTDDAFGSSVALSGGLALVGTRSNEAFLFEAGAGWAPVRRIAGPDESGLDRFGAGVVLDGTAAMIAASEDDREAVDAGAVYLIPDVSMAFAVALEVAYLFSGDASGDGFGFSVSGGGDVDDDGYDDFVVGAYFNDAGGSNAGLARVFSGVDGSTLYTFLGAGPHDIFGRSVSMAGDVNLDGFEDVVVGAPWNDGIGLNSGMVRVFSGADGTILHTFVGDDPDERLGWSVSGAGDVNADGYADLIGGAYLDDTNGTDAGSATVYSGFDGSVLYTLFGDAEGDQFGSAVSGAGDVNGDGYHDVLVGAPSDDDGGLDAGRAKLFSGLDGSEMYAFDGDPGNDFGYSVSDAGDVNADGLGDVIVGGRYHNGPGGNGGIARVFSGMDGSILYTFLGSEAGERFGYSVSGAGDVDGDGHDDLIVGSKNASELFHHGGKATVLSGHDGHILFTFLGDAEDDLLGRSVAGAGDVNGDGLADVIVGADFDDINANNSGSARIFTGPDCNGNGVPDRCDIAGGVSTDFNANGLPDECETLGMAYCSPAMNNSTGLPAVVTAIGSDLAAANDVTLIGSQLPAEQFGYFLTSLSQGMIQFPAGSQGILCVGGAIARPLGPIFDTGLAGLVVVQPDMTFIPTSPESTVMAGDTWHFQAWYRDVNPVFTSNFTDALSVSFE